MPRAGIACAALAAFLPLVSSCAKRASAPMRIDTTRIYVRLDAVVRLHPYHVASSWEHRPFQVEPISGRGQEPFRAGVFKFSSPPHSIPASPAVSPLHESKRDLQQERENIVSTFERSESRRTPAVRLAEEMLPALEEQLAKQEESIRESFLKKMEEERQRAAARIADIRLKLFPQKAFESKEAVAKRRDAVEAEITAARAKLVDLQKQLEKQMQAAIDAARSEQQEQAKRILANEQELRRNELRPYYQGQLDALERDWKEKSPQPPPIPPLTDLPDAIAPSSITAEEPPLARRSQPVHAWRNTSDLKSYIRKDARALIRQWANVHGFELAGFAPVNGVHDGTDACLTWLRDVPWKRSVRRSPL